MDIRFRRVLYIVFILFFGVLSPMLVFYVRGYTIDLEDRRITRTGTLVVESSPSRATVFLNEKVQKDRTNTIYEHLIPGDYNVRIEKSGYTSRSYRVSVRSGETTLLENVTLYAEDLSERLIDLNVTWAEQDPSRRRLLLAKEHDGMTTLLSLDTTRYADSLTPSPITTLPETSLRVVSWDLQLHRVIVQGPSSNMWMINVDSQEVESFSELYPERSFAEIEFYEQDRSLYKALEQDGTVWELNATDKTDEHLFDSAVDIAVFQNRLWLLQSDGTLATHVPGAATTTLQTIMTLPSTNRHKFTVSNDVLILETSDAMHFFSLDNGRVQITSTSSMDANVDFSIQNASVVLAHDALSLLDINPSKQKSSVLTRSSDRIHDAVLTSRAKNVLMATDKGVISLDRDRTISYTPIIIMDRVFQRLWMDQDQRTLYGLDNGTLVEYSL